MAYNRSYDTDDSAIPTALRRFIRHRLYELAGLGLFACLALIGTALATWSVNDPSLNHATDQAVKNFLGYPGAVIADELMQLMGLGVLLWIGIPMAWRWCRSIQRGPRWCALVSRRCVGRSSS